MYYVVQVKTGQEEKVIEEIKKYNNNQDVFIDVFSPFRVTLRKYHGQFKEVNERCFPGYIFIETDDVKEVFFNLYWVPEFTRLLGREGYTYNFLPLDKEEARMIDILYNRNSGRKTEISNIEVTEGDRIRILDGPLMGIESTIKKVDLHKRTIEVEFLLCSQLVTAKVGINIVTKIN